MAENDKKSFWTSIPGILTGVAAVLTAVTTLYVTLHSDKGNTKTSEVLYQREGPFHIGDEEISAWPLLHSNCIEIPFTIDSKLTSLKLELESFGAEADNPINLNGTKTAILPFQGTKKAGQTRPNEWSKPIPIKISTDKLIKGLNKLSICAEQVRKPEFSGDKDDFQIRNISLIAEKINN